MSNGLIIWDYLHILFSIFIPSTNNILIFGVWLHFHSDIATEYCKYILTRTTNHPSRVMQPIAYSNHRALDFKYQIQWWYVVLHSLTVREDINIDQGLSDQSPSSCFPKRVIVASR